MRIGIDLDGVIFNSERLYRTYGEIFDMKNGGSGQKFPDSPDVCYSYGWSEELANEFIETYFYYIQMHSPIMDNAIEIIKKLKSEGNELILITARGCISQQEIDISIKRLKEHGLEFDGFHFVSTDKLKVCQEEKIDVMIDDCINHIEKISSAGIKCLYFRDIWARPCHNKNVLEVHNWGEIYRKILSMKK